MKEYDINPRVEAGNNLTQLFAKKMAGHFH